MSTVSRKKRRRNTAKGANATTSEIPVYAYQHGRRTMVGGMVQLADGSWQLKKRIDVRKHILNTINGIGWSLDVLALAMQQGCTSMLVTDKSTGTQYETTMQQFLEKSVYVETNGEDDPQRAMPISRWRVDGHLSVYEQLSMPRVPRPPEPVQLSLIEVARYV